MNQLFFRGLIRPGHRQNKSPKTQYLWTLTEILTILQKRTNPLVSIEFCCLKRESEERKLGISISLQRCPNCRLIVKVLTVNKIGQIITELTFVRLFSY